MTQREIKFRVYGENPYNDDNKKEIYQIDSYYWEEYGSSDIDFSKNCYEDGILMQFTGLLDKNGKEIYCGDIVKSDWYEDKQRITGAKVYFSAGRFTCLGLKCDLYEMPELEVIGNIYENPELINPIN